MKRYWLFIFGISVVIVAIIIVTVHFLNGSEAPAAPAAPTSTTTTTVTVTPTTPVSATPVAPSSPRNVMTETSKNSVTLTWTSEANQPDGYYIYRDATLVATLPGNTAVFQDSGLVPAHHYSYAVTAFNQIGESAPSELDATTKNPSIRVTLDRIGVHDNGEDAIRDIDGGEVYLGVVVTDGVTSTTTKLPLEEGQFFVLHDEESVDAPAALFSTTEVGAHLRVAFVGYESDGGTGETTIYTILGTAASRYLTGGIGSILGLDSGISSVIGKIAAADDDYLGSYEMEWSPLEDWGAGAYVDITCSEEDGTPGLRLWFTIETY